MNVESDGGTPPAGTGNDHVPDGGLGPLDALRILADPYSLCIIAGTTHQEKTAIELSQRFGIPMAVAYRRVAELVDAGLLEAAGRVLTRSARRISMFRAKVVKASIEFDGQALQVRFTDRGGRMADLGGPWTALEVARPPSEWEAARTRKGTSLYFPPA